MNQWVSIRMMSVKEMKNSIKFILLHLQDLHMSYASPISNTLSVFFKRAMIYCIVANVIRLFSIMIIDVRRFKLCVFS